MATFDLPAKLLKVATLADEVAIPNVANAAKSLSQRDILSRTVSMIGQDGMVQAEEWLCPAASPAAAAFSSFEKQ